MSKKDVKIALLYYCVRFRVVLLDLTAEFTIGIALLKTKGKRKARKINKTTAAR